MVHRQRHCRYYLGEIAGQYSDRLQQYQYSQFSPEISIFLSGSLYYHVG
ncbi:hypothetical protein HCG51_21270 [Tolypothrix sp. PCC 7910]|nr:hypothetical protein [Tolypothrix sp. PCC 7910]QIR38982.1 hypothetical protein HCG51_21270 [Tolypothrix sp. PCC 7910]